MRCAEWAAEAGGDEEEELGDEKESVGWNESVCLCV
jgi:hypothetical protein